MAISKKPEAEVSLDERLVRSLLGAQHPDLNDLALVPFASGWDNQLFRLGEELVLRFPRRRLAADLVRNEQAALAVLSPLLPLPTPNPIRIGRPGPGYPWRWSVLPWLDGDVSESQVLDRPRVAEQLTEFLRALHRPAPIDAPTNPWRGQPLESLTQRLGTRVEALGDSVDGESILRLFDDLLNTPPFIGPPVWLHGDLHPLNLLARDGLLSAVIDFGDVCSGDPASDLAVAWFLFDAGDRDPLREMCDEALWRRARAWALSFSITFLSFSADDPVLETIGRRTLINALESD